MRILFVSSLYPPHTKGGGELSTHYIAKALAARGHQMQVFTSGKRYEQYEIEDIKVTQLPVPLTAKPLFEQQLSQKIAPIIEQEIQKHDQFDIIHAHDFRSAQALSELNLPNSIVTARDYAQICGSPNNLMADYTSCPGCTLTTVWKNHRIKEASLWRKPFRAWQYWYNVGYRLSSFRTFKHQVFISNAEKAEIAKQQDLTGVSTHVIYNPVPDTYIKTPLTRSREKLILYAGTVESYKGVGLLLKAFRQLAAEDSNVYLKIVGAGAQRRDYERYVDRNGLQYRVTFCDPVPWDHMIHVYDEAMVVAAPHLWVEPFGRTVVEAMARGKVVVSANIGGPSEIIQSGITGWLFDKGSTESLYKTLKNSLSMRELELREMGKEAHEWVKLNLDQDLIARRHEEVYRSMLS